MRKKWRERANFHGHKLKSIKNDQEHFIRQRKVRESNTQLVSSVSPVPWRQGGAWGLKLDSTLNKFFIPVRNEINKVCMREPWLRSRVQTEPSEVCNYDFPIRSMRTNSRIYCSPVPGCWSGGIASKGSKGKPRGVRRRFNFGCFREPGSWLQTCKPHKLFQGLWKETLWE